MVGWLSAFVVDSARADGAHAKLAIAAVQKNRAIMASFLLDGDLTADRHQQVADQPGKAAYGDAGT